MFSNFDSQSERRKRNRKQGTQPIQDLLKYTKETFNEMQKLEIWIQSEGKSGKKTAEYRKALQRNTRFKEEFKMAH
jgi:hypothetical protein